MNWNDIADAYLSISEDRDRILFPTLAKVIEETGARSLVDVGGGDGRFIELTYRNFENSRFSELGYTDTSSRMRERARLRLSNFDNIRFFESLNDIPKNQWSIVTLIAVWMSIETDEECVTLLKKVKSLLGDNGRLVAAITHPCFRNKTFHSYSTNFDIGNYFRSGRKFKVNLYDSVRSLAIWDTHWTLSDHINQLIRAGLVIESIIELPDVEDDSEGSPWLVIIAK